MHIIPCCCSTHFTIITVILTRPYLGPRAAVVRLRVIRLLARDDEPIGGACKAVRGLVRH
eukprot:1028169-Pyramimonas_sp.AAC.1